jgi:hypothetical protein
VVLFDAGLVVQALQQLALAIQMDAYFYSKGDKHRCSWQARCSPAARTGPSHCA